MTMLELKVPPPLGAAVVAAAMYLVSAWTPGLHLLIPAAATIAAALGTAGVAVNVAALWAFRRHRTTVNPLRPDNATALVTDGIFAWTRNPMYLGMTLVALGAALWAGRPLMFLAPVLVFAVANFFFIPFEEAKMRRQFGEQFDGYTKRVRRWI